MNKKMMAMDDDVENVGIMQGLMDSMAEEDDDEGDDEDPAEKMERRPDTPEILMNNLRGDMRSIEARRDELADLVGYQAATETPESVLAMLQPVLAKQGGGGIGALPQSAPMAQGPQPPMMGGAPGMPPPGMPPVPADMGMPPPGMPSMPPGADMPPPPQQGGIAELMAGMGGGAPASDQPPIAMAKGGYVQNFNLGSDEEGVTPAAAQGPSDAGMMMFPPEMVAAAQRQAMGTLNQQPTKAPSIEEATMGRLPFLNKMLGPDRNAMQAQMLFDLGQRAFGFAANTDETGKPLRGSFISRLAGATRTLPAAMGKQLDQITQIDRQIKTLALQQGEKDVDKVAAQNAELEKRKGSLLNEVLRAQAKIEAKKIGGAATTAFGNSLDGRIMNSFVTLGPKVEDGTATPQEQQIFSLAKDKWLEPKIVPIIDPVTKMITGYREVRRELPQILTRGNASSGQSVPPLPMGGGATSNQSVPPLPMGQAGTSPASTAEAAAAPEINLFGDRFKISGPVSAAVNTITGIPGLGNPYGEVTIARQQAELTAERLMDSFLKSTQGSVEEQKRLNKVINIRPSASKDPDNYASNLIGLGTVVRDIIRENEQLGMADSGLTPEAKGNARKKAAELKALYPKLNLPPVVNSKEEAQRLGLKPGSLVLFGGKQLIEVDDY